MGSRIPGDKARFARWFGSLYAGYRVEGVNILFQWFDSARNAARERAGKVGRAVPVYRVPCDNKKGWELSCEVGPIEGQKG